MFFFIFCQKVLDKPLVLTYSHEKHDQNSTYGKSIEWL